MKKIRNTAGKNKEKRYGVMAALLSAGLVLGMTVEPLSVQAAGSGVLPTAGVAAVLEQSLTTEEYIQIAREAAGSSWGYTNIGIADVESGNLNVRAIPDASG